MQTKTSVWCLALLSLTLPGIASAEPKVTSDNIIAGQISDTASSVPVGSKTDGKPLQVAVSRAADLVGRPMFADRSTVGTSATQVSFSDHPVVSVQDSRPGAKGALPLHGARLTSRFGYRRNPVGGDWRMHSGIDLAAPLGTPVVAAKAGMVRYADWRGGYGLLVTLEHGDGLETRYGHLSRVSVRPGQTIGAGDLLGYVGSTGNSTGPHLHYETRLNGRAYDPAAR